MSIIALLAWGIEYIWRYSRYWQACVVLQSALMFFRVCGIIFQKKNNTYSSKLLQQNTHFWKIIFTLHLLPNGGAFTRDDNGLFRLVKYSGCFELHANNMICMPRSLRANYAPNFSFCALCQKIKGRANFQWTSNNRESKWCLVFMCCSISESKPSLWLCRVMDVTAKFRCCFPPGSLSNNHHFLLTAQGILSASSPTGWSIIHSLRAQPDRAAADVVTFELWWVSSHLTLVSSTSAPGPTGHWFLTYVLPVCKWDRVSGRAGPCLTTPTKDQSGSEEKNELISFSSGGISPNLFLS